MRELLTSLLLATCLFPVGVGVLHVSTTLAEESAPHTFADLNADPLWPSEIRRINPKLQAYDRLPAVTAADTMIAEAKPTHRVNVTVRGVQPQDNLVVASDTLMDTQSVKAREWCAARYRSYDAADNSYQPYGGGSRRECLAPAETIASNEMQIAGADIAARSKDHARWCLERYSSYRIEDNSYQPFSGGRKQCPGSSTLSATNSVQASANSSTVQF